MIVGTGVDLVRTDRVRRLLRRFPKRFPERICGDSEWEEWQRDSRGAAWLAKRFAAKEAAAKALGTGFRRGIRYRDIVIVHDALGAPALQLAGEAARRASELGALTHHLSISDEKDLAMAFVVLERGAPDAC